MDLRISCQKMLAALNQEHQEDGVYSTFAEVRDVIIKNVTMHEVLKKLFTVWFGCLKETANYYVVSNLIQKLPSQYHWL